MAEPTPGLAAAEPDVVIERRGVVLDVRLNRPRALNALSLPMIRVIHPALAAAERDPGVACVVLRGAGGRAFCAGGDVRGLALTLKQPGQTLSYDFFHEEYRLNHLIHRFAKPILPLVEGVSMGGGVGLSVHAPLRICAEDLAFAMPETAIGLFPDVGGTWFLNRFTGQSGMYLALTGHKIGAADALHVGYATHVVAARRMDELHAALVAAAPATVDAARAVVEPFVIGAGASDLANRQDAIDRVFAAPTYVEVLQRLAGEDAPWAAAALADLAKRSPTSLRITFEQLRAGRMLDIKSCLIREFRMAQACMAGHDFAEGIRAVLIDKDHAPKWKPARLEDVDQALVAAHFRPLGDRDLTFEDD
jgi:enoyl-CoA hydratase